MTITRSTRPTAAVLVQTSQSFRPAIEYLAEAMRRRQIRRSYGRMSEVQLRDINLTPWDLEVALSLPLNKSASDALFMAAASETARW